MVIIEPRETHDRYGRKSGRWENTITQEGKPTQPYGCCAGGAACSKSGTAAGHASPKEAVDALQLWRARQLAQSTAEFSSLSLPCSLCGLPANWRVSSASLGESAILCVSHRNIDGVRSLHEIERLAACGESGKAEVLRTEIRERAVAEQASAAEAEFAQSDS